MAKIQSEGPTHDNPPTKKARTSYDPSVRRESAHEIAALRRFARNGGPDLTSLRGFRIIKIHSMPRSSSSSKQKSNRTRSRGTATDDTSVVSRRSRSSASDPSFARNLLEHHIYSDSHGYFQKIPVVEPANSKHLRQKIETSRSSLSLSRRDEKEYSRFRETNATALSEAKVMSQVVPFFNGQSSGAPSQENLVFNNLTSLTDGATVDPKPDIFDGAAYTEVHPLVRKDLDGLIIPTKHVHAPVAPNFFFEAKSSLGAPDNARHQITYDLAAGSRAMNALQNYKELSTALYDGNAYALGATYHASGLLKIYAGHMHPGPAGPETHVTQIKGFDMTGDAETYFKGLAAYRNARDLASEFRNDLIHSANSIALVAEHKSQVVQTMAEEDEGNGTDDDHPRLSQPSGTSSPALEVSFSQTGATSGTGASTIRQRPSRACSKRVKSSSPNGYLRTRPKSRRPPPGK